MSLRLTNGYVLFLFSVLRTKSNSLSCFMIVHIFKDKHEVAGNIHSLNLLVCDFLFYGKRFIQKA